MMLGVLPERLEITPSARNQTKLGLGVVAFVILGIVLIASGEPGAIAIGVLCILFFGGGGVWTLLRSRRNLTRIILSRAGIEAPQSLYVEGLVVPWSAVEHVEAFSYKRAKMVGIRLQNYDFVNQVPDTADADMQNLMRYAKWLMGGVAAAAIAAGEIPDGVEAAQMGIDFHKVPSSGRTLASLLAWSRKHLGYDISMGALSLDRSPAEMVALLRQYAE